MWRGRILTVLDRVAFLAALCAVACVLGGCPGGGDSGASSGPPVPPAVLDAIVAYFVTRKTLNFGSRDRTTRKVDRHQGFFVRRRAATHGRANPTWATEPNQPTLRARIDTEFDAVRAYLTAKLGPRSTPSAFVRSQDTIPRHLDLAWAGHVLSSTSSARASTLQAEYVGMRRYWVTAIVWRAAGILDDLWQPSADLHSATLRTAALDELVDRRLRTCERLHHQVSSANALASGARLSGTAPTGPWSDDFLIRFVEYPRVRITFGPSIPGAIGAANIAEWNVAAPSQDWQWENHRHARIVWTRGSVRMAAPSAAHWQLDSGDRYRMRLEPSGSTTAAQAMALLFQTSTDWWGRSWMFCDHVVSALHIEALWLGLTRRTGSDAAFNDVLSSNSSGFVSLWAMVGNHNNILMGGQSDDHWFDNLGTLESNLQIGDQLILWNSFLYPFIATAEWRLENSIIMDIESDPMTGEGTIARDALQLQGHGIGQKGYSQYMAEIAGYLAEGLAIVRQALVTYLSTHAADTQFLYTTTRSTIIRWDPYDTFSSVVTGRGGGTIAGAWWVRIPVGSGTSWPDADAAALAIPKAVRDEPSPGPGYRHSNGGSGTDTSAVYFPLFEPAGGWPAYFALRRSGSTAPVQTRLREVMADRQLAPGLFRSGVDDSDIAIVRARVRP